MKRKALIGILILCLLVGLMPISCGVGIKMPDELPNGQKLVKTGGEDVLGGEGVGEIFPYYTGCEAYEYSINPTLSAHPPRTGETLIVVCIFNSENDARNDLHNAPTMLIPEFIDFFREKQEKSEYRIGGEEQIQALLDFYNNTKIPGVYTAGDDDVVIFQIDNKLLLVMGDDFFTVAETIYSLNAEAAMPSEEELGIPGFEVLFAMAGLLIVAYLLVRKRAK